MLGIQKRLFERIGLLFRLLPFRLSRRQESRDNIWKCSFEILGIPTHTHAALHLLRILSEIAILCSPDIKLNIRPRCASRRRRLIFLGTVIKSEKCPIQVIVFHPYEGIVGYILADDRAGIQRGKVRNSYGGLKVESGFGCQDNRPFIGILLRGFFTAWLSQDFHALFSLITFAKDEGLDLDSLASRKDVSYRNGTCIRHCHCIVEHVELLIEFHRQIAILYAVGGHLGAICGPFPVEFEDVLGADIILDNGPLHNILGRRYQVLRICGCRKNEGLVWPDTHYLEFFNNRVPRLIQEHDISPCNHVACVLCLYNPLRIRRLNSGTLSTHKVLTDIVELVGGE